MGETAKGKNNKKNETRASRKIESPSQTEEQKMRGWMEIWYKDDTFDTFGPYDATDEKASLASFRYWARVHCRTGRVKACFIHGFGAYPMPFACYRSKGDCGYQVARGFRVQGALAKPNWRG